MFFSTIHLIELVSKHCWSAVILKGKTLDALFLMQANVISHTNILVNCSRLFDQLAKVVCETFA